MKKRVAVFLLLILLCSGLRPEDNPFDRGVAFFKEKNYPKAIEELEKVVDDRDTNLLIGYYLGLSFYYQKNYKDASAHLKYYLLNTPLDNFQTINNALSTLFTVQRINRTSEEIIEIGELYLEKIKGKKSFERLTKLIGNNLSNAYLALGNQSFYRKDYKEAKELYTKALLFNPESHNVIERIAVSNYSLSLYEEAEKDLVYLLESEVKNWWLLSSSAYYLTEIKKPEGAFIEGLTAKNPAASSILRSYVDFKEGSYEASFAAVQKAEEKYNTGGEIIFNIISRVREPNFDASRVYTLFIKNYPLSKRNEYVVTRLLAINRGREDKEGLKKELMDIIRKNISGCGAAERLPGLEKMLADVEFDNPDEGESLFRGKLSAYSDIIKRYPEGETTKSIIFEAAKIYADKLGEYDRAISMFEELAGKSNYRNSSVELVRTHIRAENYGSAVALSREFLKERPDDEQLKMLLGEALLENGDTDEGIRFLQSLYEKTHNTNTKKRMLSIFDSYEKIAVKEDIGLDSFVFLSIDETESYFSNLPDIRGNLLLLGQKIKSMGIHPFSVKRQALPLVVEVHSQDKPSLVEPCTLYIKEREGYRIKWEGEVAASDDRWRKISPYRVIYPWYEEKKPDIQVSRRSINDDKNMTVEIEMVLSPGIWKIKILNPSRGGRFTEVEPAPDLMDNSLISYTGVSKLLRVKIVYPLNPAIVNYYPEVVISKDDLVGSLLTDKLSDEFRDGEVYLKAGAELGGLYVTRRRGKVFTMTEKIERR